MTFKVIDTKTGKEPTAKVIDNIAKKRWFNENGYKPIFCW